MQNTEKKGPGKPPLMDLPNREQALAKFFAVWQPDRKQERVPLDQSCGRTSAQALYSVLTLPLAHVAACDGVAVRSDRFAGGLPDTTGWEKGRDYVMADTGDDFPDEYDAVIRIEEVTFREDGTPVFSCKTPLAAGTGVREAGSTIRQGDLLIQANQVIRPTDLAALAMGGAQSVPVWKKPVVAFLPTGSELIPWDKTPSRGDNIDSNSLMVAEMLKTMGAEAISYPVTADVLDSLHEVLHDALEKADIIILNGGSSKGGEDYSTRLIREEGELILHQVAAVPGRPMAFGIVQGKAVINLPGPPLAAYFGTDWCIRALLDHWLMHVKWPRHTETGVLKADLGPGGPVEILQRIQVSVAEDGTLELLPLNIRKDSSADIMNSAAQYVMPIFDRKHEAGEELTVELLR